MKLHGIHHVTCITGDAPAERRVLHRHARAAAGQEDGQPGRPDRLPPLLRRRARLGRRRHHVLRVPGRDPRAAPATGWCTASSSASAARSRSTSGSSASAASASTAALRLRRSGGARARAGRRRRRATRRSSRAHPEIPEEHALRGFAGVRAYASNPERSAPLARAPRRFDARGRRLGVARDAPRLLRLRPAAGRRRGIPGAGTVHHVAWSVPLDEHAAWVQKAARGRRAADAGDRPLLVPLDLLPRAERRALRDRLARARASPPTRSSSTSARS